MQQSRAGVTYIFLSAFLFSWGGLLIKLIPWSSLAINGARSILSVVMILLFMIARREKFHLSWGVALGGVFTFFTCFLFIISNKLTTAANTIILQYTAPAFLIGMMWLFFREKPNLLDVITCALVLTGIVFFFLDGLSSGNMLGNFLALVSGVTYGGVFMMNRLPSGHPMSSVLLGHGLCALIGFPALARETDFSPTAILFAVILGVFQLGLGYIFLCKGLGMVSPVTSSLIAGLEPILNPILVMIFYPQEKLSFLSVAGGFVVVVTVVGYNVIKSSRLRQATAAAKTWKIS